MRAGLLDDFNKQAKTRHSIWTLHVYKIMSAGTVLSFYKL